MTTTTIKIDPAEPQAAAMEQAAEVIEAGGLVAFPTETVYGIACKAAKDSLARLDDTKGRASGKHYTLHIAHKTDVHKYVPEIGLRAHRLIRKCWPGPLTMVFELDAHASEHQHKFLGDDLFSALYHDNSIGVRCPSNAVAAALLTQASTPIVAPSANVSDAEPALDAEAVLAQLDGRIDMVLDGGPCTLGQSSTVVKLGSKGLEVLREGAFSTPDIEQLARVQFMFVCTGNSCRSPMAEGLFRKYLAQKLNCPVDQLQAMGYKVLSAGTLGIDGLPASAESVVACAARGVDISSHGSRGLSADLIEDSDLIFAMERNHADRVINMCPEAADRCSLLAPTGISDPIGQPQAVYDMCADQIDRAVEKIVSELGL